MRRKLFNRREYGRFSSSAILICLTLSLLLAALTPVRAGDEAAGTSENQLRIGWAQTDITPLRATALLGQNFVRIGVPSEAHDPLTATAMAIESPDEGHAMLVSVDLVGAYDLGLRLRDYIAGQPTDDRIAGLDLGKLIIFATHTHTGPYISNTRVIPKGTMSGQEYSEFLVPKLADLIARAWQNRQIASLATAQATAPVGFNRIALYDDGHAEMYGDTSLPSFVRMEGPVDHTAELMYTWDQDGTLSGVLINLANPSQVLEAEPYISADYWHEVRKQLRAHADIPEGVFVLPVCGAAGDQAPRDQENHELTLEDTCGHRGTRTIGRIVTEAVVAALPAATAKKNAAPVVANATRSFELPRKPEHGNEPFPVVLHALRIGDAVVVDTPFELYTAYGLEIKKRSAAAQTFIAQLASGPAYGMYLPTAEAIPGGGYGSRPMDGQVGPDGGEILVDETVDLIATLFGDQNTSGHLR